LLALIAIFPHLQAAKKKTDTEPYALVSGTVFRDPGFALPNATVTLTPAEPQGTSTTKIKKLQTVSNGRGEFVFHVPPIDMHYLVRAVANGYHEEEKSVQVQGENACGSNFVAARRVEIDGVLLMNTKLVNVNMAVASCLVAVLFTSSVIAQNDDSGTRSVQGIVNDASGKPVAGAVVQLKDTKSLQIRSYRTEADGSYHFSGLNANVEYELEAKNGDATSGKKTLSVFNTQKVATVNLKLK
jgi:hypothetical protein